MTRTSSRRRRLRLTLTTAVLACAAAILGLPAPAVAATNSTAPRSGTWGAWKACPSKYSGDNCAAVYGAAENRNTHTLFVGGDFTAALNSSTGARAGYQNLMAVDSSTGALKTGFARHTFNGTVFAVAVDVGRNRVYVGGNFTTVDGSAAGANHVAAFSMTTGAHLSGFNPAPKGPVRALVYSGTTDLLYLGGRFNLVNGKPRSRIAAVSPVGGGLSSRFVPPSVKWTESKSLPEVRSLAIGADATGRGMLYVGGHFDSINGQRQLSLMRVRLGSGAFDSGFRPSLDHFTADSLMAVDGIAYVKGGIIVGQAGHRNRAYRFGLNGGLRWRLYTDGDVQTVAVHGSSVYIGGHFHCVERSGNPTCKSATTGWKRIHLAALNPNTGAVDPNFAPKLEPTSAPNFMGVWMLHVSSSGTLWVGGFSTKVVVGGHTYNRPKLAAFPGR